MSILGKLAIAVTVGFLGAYSFTMTSGLVPVFGLREDRIGPLTFVSGLILFFLTLTLLAPVGRLIQKILEALSRVEERPGPAVTLGMLGMGTLCAIAAMVVQYNALGTRSGGSFGLAILSILTFLLGASMIALGIWASLKPASTTPAHAIKPKAPEFDETIA